MKKKSLIGLLAMALGFTGCVDWGWYENHVFLQVENNSSQPFRLSTDYLCGDLEAGETVTLDGAVLSKPIYNRLVC